MSQPLVSSILSFWFSDAVSPLWFKPSNEFDAELTEKYEHLWQQAANGDYDHWQESTDGAIALVLILDQFPLNMFRGQAKRYSTEEKAREIARYAINNNLTKKITSKQKSFLYLPFMHSEALNDQQYAIDLFTDNNLPDNVKYARHHYAVIEQFGRFPHRNIELGRESTAAEIDYLKTANW